MAITKLRTFAAEHNPEALLADGFEEAFIGMAERCALPALAVYDINTCIDILMTRDGMAEEDAEEFLQFNTLGAYAGDHTPVFLWRFHRRMP
jgi:hypothetical protein